MDQNDPKMICSIGIYQTSLFLNRCLSSSKHYIKLMRGKTTRTQNLITSLKQESHSISQARIGINGNPQIVRKTFQNQKKVNVFKKVHDHKLDIKLDQPQRTIKHVMQAYGIEQSQMGWQNLTFGKCETLPLMCFKYSIGSLKTHSKDVIYHMLHQIFKFSAIKMQCTQDNQENFTWVAMWAKG